MLVMIRYGEIFLKGKNRSYFENRLIENIRQQCSASKVWKSRNRVFAELAEEQLHLLKFVFGIHSYSPVMVCSADYPSIQSLILAMQKDLPHTARFRVSCSRQEKIWESSKEIERTIGAFIVERFSWKVDLKNFDVNIVIDLADADHVYLSCVSHPGFGGLPVGVSGNVLTNIASEQDLSAALIMLKRGCRAYLRAPVSAHLVQKLQRYSPFPLKEVSGDRDSLSSHKIIAQISSASLDSMTLLHDATISNAKNPVPTLYPMIVADAVLRFNALAAELPS